MTFRTGLGRARVLVERDRAHRDGAPGQRRRDHAVATRAPAPATGAGITVSPQQAWTSTGHHRAEGRSGSRSTRPAKSRSAATPTTSRPPTAPRAAAAPGAPLPTALAGALIGRIGNGRRSLIGSQTACRCRPPVSCSSASTTTTSHDNQGDVPGRQVTPEAGDDAAAETLRQQVDCPGPVASHGSRFLRSGSGSAASNRQQSDRPRTRLSNAGPDSCEPDRCTKIVRYPWRTGKTRSTCPAPTSR